MNYLKATLRYLWRNRLFTGLNILALSIGLSASIVVLRIVDYELSFDKGLGDVDDYIQLAIKNESPDFFYSGIGAVAQGMAPRIEHDATGVEAIVPMYYHPDNEGGFDRRVAILPAYFDMVQYRWLAGDPATAIDKPRQVVLTRSRAARYYPQAEPTMLIGKTVPYDENTAMTISGVVDDLPYNSSFDAQEFFRISDQEWPDVLKVAACMRCLLFLKLHAGVSREHVLAQINAINERGNRGTFEGSGTGYRYEYTLIPLAERHYASAYYMPFHRTVNIKVLYGLGGIAVFLLLLAVINYVNLSTALLPRRSREIGVRKTLGGMSHQLAGRFMGETLCITLVAMALSCLLQGVFVVLFSDYFPVGMVDDLNYPHMAMYLVGLVIVITLLSSIYPGWLLTRVNVVNVLKGKVDLLGSGVSFRRALIVFQFVVAQIFIVGALIISLQLRYTLTKDLGFAREAVLTIDLLRTDQQGDSARFAKQQVFKRALFGQPGVEAVSLGEMPMGGGMVISQTEFDGPSGPVTIDLAVKGIDEDWIDLYGIRLLAGRLPRNAGAEILVNETTVKAVGYASAGDAVGEWAGVQQIVGVVADFHQFDMHVATKPLMLQRFGSFVGVPNAISVRLSPSNWPQTIGRIAGVWANLYPETPFAYRFYDETIRMMHEQEYRLAKTVNYATGVTILVSCLGLFGLVTLSAYQRTREIGIRKVLGASVSRIVTLLSKEFVWLVLIAMVIASPVAWWVMGGWLADFAYRIDIAWWMFALGGGAAIVIALLTVAGQAFRAAVANPVDSLREE